MAQSDHHVQKVPNSSWEFFGQKLVPIRFPISVVDIETKAIVSKWERETAQQKPNKNWK